MLCEQCGAKRAEIHIVNFVNQERQVRHLCRDCARERLKVDDMSNFMKMSFAFEGLMSIEEAFKELFVPALRGAYSKKKNTSRLCPHCGGVLPDYMFGDLAEDYPREAPHEQADNQNLTAEEEAAELEKMMRAAVKAEDYEHAAELRDRISELRNSRKHEKSGDGEQNI